MSVYDFLTMPFSFVANSIATLNDFGINMINSTLSIFGRPLIGQDFSLRRALTFRVPVPQQLQARLPAGVKSDIGTTNTSVVTPFTDKPSVKGKRRLTARTLVEY